MKKTILLFLTLLVSSITSISKGSNFCPDSTPCTSSTIIIYYPDLSNLTGENITYVHLKYRDGTEKDLTIDSIVGDIIFVKNDGYNCTDSLEKIDLKNASGQKKFHCYCYDKPSPLTLIEYTYKKVSENSIYLRWITASELNNSHFEILKSFDGIHYFPLTVIKSSGVSNTINTYGVYDNIYRNNNYFMLIQHDFDGKTDTLGVVAVPYTPIVLNLFNDNNSVVLTLTKPSKVKIYNDHGVLIEDLESLDSGSFIINTYYYPPGMYFIEVNGEISEISKFRVY